MTREEFIKILDDSVQISYIIDGDYIVITHGGFDDNGKEKEVNLDYLEEIPSGVKFINDGDIFFDNLKILPPDVIFNNTEDVFLDSLKTLPPSVHFNNKGRVYLRGLKLKNLPIGVEFNGNITNSFMQACKIKGISPNRVLSLLIKQLYS